MAGLFNVQLDGNTLGLIERFGFVGEYWKTFMNDLSYEIGKEAVTNMKEIEGGRTKAMWEGTVHSTGEFENSITNTITNTGNGFTIEFNGAAQGNFIDNGNGTSVIYASGIAMCISPRYETQNFFQSVQPMSEEYITHFSEKTGKYIGENIHNLADEHIEKFFEKLVK